MLNLRSVPGAASGRSHFRAEWVETSGRHASLRHLGRKLAAMYEGLSSSPPDPRLAALRDKLATSERADGPAPRG